MAGYTVMHETKDLELSKVKSGINIRVKSGNRTLGRLKIGKGGVWWYTKGAAKPQKMTWHEFAEKM